MKKLMILAVMAIASLTANAQQEVGTWSVTPKVGVNLATITDADDASFKFGLMAGADLHYQLTDKFAVSAGLFYSMQGAKEKINFLGETVKYTYNLDYVNIPILANYYVIPGLAIKLGLQPAFNVKHKVKGESHGNSSETDIEHFKSFDLAIPIGASYQFGDFVVDARYNFGLTKIWDYEGSSSKNSVIQFTFGYIIPF